MTNIYSSYKTIAVAAAVAFGAIAFSSISANASITNQLMKCQASTKEKAVSCCNAVIKREGAPLWFNESQGSCNSVVACAKSKESTVFLTAYVLPPKKRCGIVIPHDDNQGSGGVPAPKPNGRQTIPH